ncbi:MAG: hypothetical protein Q8922_12430 [Bacteroidota bacterium]|nr:hypothetical protein [Bacteroidota bacterium]MDP4232203.1 hypothetical protein [Bacteroidota bacterium]MDP4243616.1 hypothetical protein [Bacteroidota bacterium]MDP4288731.1 hypothetical protein [Bacteroidota bacterium]
MTSEQTGLTMSRQKDLKPDEIKRLFRSKGYDYYYQLQKPEEADFIFIGLDANRPPYSKFGLVESERAFLKDGKKWCMNNGILHPILTRDPDNPIPGDTAALKYWKHALAVIGPLKNASRCSMVELLRWPTFGACGFCVSSLLRPTNRKYLAWLADFISESKQKKFFMSPSVIGMLNHTELKTIVAKVFPRREVVMDAAKRRPHRIGKSNIHVIGHFSARDSKDRISKTVSHVQEVFRKYPK